MAREDINIGVEGNDGTGDSIREAFRKVNENFQEIYAIFGLGGAVGFTSLNDTPDSLTRPDPDDPEINLGNLIPSTNSAGTAILLKQLVGDGIEIDTSNPDQIILSNTGGAINNDRFPKIGGPMDAGTERSNPSTTGNPIARVRIDQQAVQAFNDAHGLTGFDRITIDDLVIDKKYADTSYLSKTGDDSSGAVGLRDEPIDTTGYFYVITQVDPETNEATITNHGFNDGINGKPFIFNGLTGSDLISGTTYYLHKVDDNTVTLHDTSENGKTGFSPLFPALGQLTNARYNSSLEGNWLENEGLPRKSVVRRQGDTMDGELYLNDHPGLYKGIDTFIKEDFQAATKYYVDQNAGKISNFQIFVSTDGSDNPVAPFGLEGRSSRYAFRTIGRACELAEEQIAGAGVRPGPYMQTITANDGSENSTVNFKGFADTTAQGLYLNLQALITANIEFLKEEAVSYVESEFPNFVYDRQIYKDDIENILKSIILDVRAGQNVNVLTRIAGLKYFSNVSNRIKIGDEFDETVAAIERVQELLPSILTNQPVIKTSTNSLDQTFLTNPAEATAAEQINSKFEIIKDIIGGDDEGNIRGLNSAPPLIEGSTYQINISNGGNGATDQAVRGNFDLRQGKVIRGVSSGAIGRIVEYLRGGQDSVDEVYLQLLEPVEFELNEELEFGNFIKDIEISIHIDAGTYEEQLPIRVPQNTSLVGDEMRRVIVRPAKGVSQSKWADLYFYRDQDFDGLDILPTSNPIAVDKIDDNTRFVVQETIAWIDEQISNAGPADIWSGFTYNETEFQNDVKYFIDAIRFDIVFDANYRSISSAIKYVSQTNQFITSNQRLRVAEAFGQSKLLTANTLTDSTAISRSNALWDEIIDIILNGPGSANTFIYPDAIDYNSTYLIGFGDARDQVTDNRTFIVREIISWMNFQIQNNIPPFTELFRYDVQNFEKNINLILDALIYDLSYGGNLQTYDAALAYYIGTTPQFKSGEKDILVASYGRLKTVIEEVISETTVDRSLGNAIEQDKSNLPGSSESVTFAGDRINEIIDFIDNDGIVLPTRIEPSITWVSGALQAEFALLDATSQNSIATQTTIYINNQIANAPPFDQWAGFEYNDIKCQRDLTIVLGGIIKDVKYGGNANSYTNAKAYFIGATSQVIGQQTQTAAALDFAKDLVLNYILTNVSYPNPRQTSQVQIIDPLTTAESGVSTKVDTLMSLISNVIVNGIPALSNLEDPRYGYHYLTDPTDQNSTPKDSAELDVFLLNDATIIRNMSPTGHGGFMCVLDPEGQILTKSPYIQTGSSFSQSANKQAFRGGMFVDAWAGNTPMVVVNVINPFLLEVESIGNTGLFYKKPETPAPFYIDGIRYQVNAIQKYNQNLGKCTLVLDRTSGRESEPGSGIFLGFQEDLPPYNPDNLVPVNRSGGYQIILQTAGGRSMLGNDFTQINDLGYGCVGRNGALIELVSQFTYYCHTAYYADSGSQIRSLNGSNAYGNFGLVAAGSDPNEIPDAVELVDDMVQTALIYDETGGGSPTYFAREGELFVYVYGTNFVPHARGELEVDHGTVSRTDPDTGVSFLETIGIVRYEIQTVQDVSASDGVFASHDGGRDTTIYKLGFSTSGDEGRSKEGVQYPIPNDTPVVLRCNQNFHFDDVSNTTPIRPSTAVEFDEVAGQVYRSIAFNNELATGEAIPFNASVVTVDSTYDYLRFTVVQSLLENAHPDAIELGYSGTLGSTIGDKYIAVEPLTRSLDGSPDDIDRVETGRFTLGWAGKIHRVVGYAEYSNYAIIELEDVNNDANLLANRVPGGIVQPLVRNGYDITLRAGLRGKGSYQNQSVQDGTITFQISTCRATGHDFLDIGTGGYNTTNYPNVIFGGPTIIPETPNPREVDERTQGRVFYVSTDQDGFFRVGKFFTVDQGTGTVTFSAAIALSNLDGLGFKRGVVVTAFLTDTGMTDNATDAVPTQSAVVGYVNRRLSFDQTGQPVDDYLSRYVNSDNGQMYSTLNLNDNLITNLADVESNNADDSLAVNKKYVDEQVDFFSRIEKLRDSEIINPEVGDLFTYTGYKRIIVINNSPGNWQSLIGQTFTATSGAQGTIIDVQDDVQRAFGVTILTYEPIQGTGTVLSIDTIVIGSVSGTVVKNGGPFDEFGNAHIGDDGDISVSVYRPGVDGSSLLDTVIDFNLNDTVIANNHVKTDAGIDQFKLNLNSATTYPLDNVGSITQNNLGVAAFDDDEFISNSGLVSLSDNGVRFNKLPEINKNQAFARISDNTGDATAVNFSDIVTLGGDFTTTGQGDGKIVKTLTSGGINAGSRLQLNSNDALKITGSTSNQVSVCDTGGTARLLIQSDSLFLAGNILPDNTASNRNIGSATNVFNKAWITEIEGTANQARYADLAEKYLGDSEYDEGTVLIFGGSAEVTVTNQKGDRRVAGVVSSNPAYLMNSGLDQEYAVAVALQGRVPVKVIGKVQKGDMLITSAIPGYAIVDNNPNTGAVIGKALEEKLNDDKGIIEVVVGRV